MTTLDEAAIQLATTLAIESIPAKLRCGSCNKLAIDALKLPCCAQSICEPCSLTLPETCPICSHSPVSAEDCTPIKSLRMSVKAFLKNEQKKRNKDIEAAAPPPVIPAAEPTPAAEQPTTEGINDVLVNQSKEASVNGQTESKDGAPVDSIEAVPESQAIQEDENVGIRTSVDAEAELEDDEDDEDNVIITTERPEQEIEEQQQHAGDESHDQNGDNQGMQQNYGNGNTNGDFGFGHNQTGFGGMDFNNMNNFNPMMMQNGMGMPNFMGMQNMMGMPGINMDPSMMFNGGFGMGGMNDMSMMGMGMPMGNMGGFNGMPGMGMGGGPGFFPGNGGYNQQNFGNSMQQNFHHNRGFGGRPYNNRGFRGRGFGYNRGRGNWQNQGQFQHNPNYMTQQHQQSQQDFQGADDSSIHGQPQVNRRGSPSYEPMNGAEQATGDTSKDQVKTILDDPGDTNKADIYTTNQIGGDAAETKVANAEDAEGIKAVGGEDTEGMYDSVERSPAQAYAQSVANEANAEVLMEDVVNAVSSGDVESERAAIGTDMEGVAEDSSLAAGGQQDSAAMHDGVQGQGYDQQYQQGYGYGGRGRGGFRGGRGGFRGRGGAYGYVATPGEVVQPAAPPVNAPIGPKAFREGKPNSWIYSKPQQPSAPAPSPPVAGAREPSSARDERDRSRSRSRPRSDRDRVKESNITQDEYDIVDETRHDKRRRRDDKYEDERNGAANGDRSSHKGRSRSETPEDDKSRRRHRDKDDHHSSRSRRERSKDRHRRRHRSRTPDRDANGRDGDANESHRKSKSDRRYDDDRSNGRDKEKNRKSSRREEDHERDHKDRTNTTSKQSRSGRDDREREREREKHRPVLEEPQDDIGFKIKGSRSAAMQASLNDTSMAPPTSFSRDRDSRRQSTASTPKTPPGDPYAEERERRQRERLDRENTLRRQSTQSLGKRTSRDEDEIEAPMGPKSDAGRAGKKARRTISYKYEDEVGEGYEDRDRRWR